MRIELCGGFDSSLGPFFYLKQWRVSLLRKRIQFVRGWAKVLKGWGSRFWGRSEQLVPNTGAFCLRTIRSRRLCGALQVLGHLVCHLKVD